MRLGDVILRAILGTDVGYDPFECRACGTSLNREHQECPACGSRMVTDIPV
jgi:hypothetical protein